MRILFSFQSETGSWYGTPPDRHHKTGEKTLLHITEFQTSYALRFVSARWRWHNIRLMIGPHQTTSQWTSQTPSLYRKCWNSHLKKSFQCVSDLFNAPFRRHIVYVHVVLNVALISSFSRFLSLQTKWRSFSWLPSSSLWSLAVCYCPVWIRDPNRRMMILSTDMFQRRALTEPLRKNGQSELKYYKSSLSFWKQPITVVLLQFKSTILCYSTTQECSALNSTNDATSLKSHILMNELKFCKCQLLTAGTCNTVTAKSWAMSTLCS